MKFYRVFRDGYFGVGEVFSNRQDAWNEASRMKQNFEQQTRERMARVPGGTFYDSNFMAFECDAEGNRTF